MKKMRLDERFTDREREEWTKKEKCEDADEVEDEKKKTERGRKDIQDRVVTFWLVPLFCLSRSSPALVQTLCSISS